MAAGVATDARINPAAGDNPAHISRIIIGVAPRPSRSMHRSPLSAGNFPPSSLVGGIDTAIAVAVVIAVVVVIARVF